MTPTPNGLHHLSGGMRSIGGSRASPEYRARRALQDGGTAISVGRAVGAKPFDELGCQLSIGCKRTGELFGLGDFSKLAANPQQDRIARGVVILIAFDLREKRRERVVPANDHGEVRSAGGD